MLDKALTEKFVFGEQN